LAKLSEDVHALSYRLHPSVIEDLGLIAALRAECDRVSRNESLRVDLDCGTVTGAVPPDVALCLFRVVQEALRNIARHAKATDVKVVMGPSDGGLLLTIRDNGAGFDKSRVEERASLGLVSMRERVHLLGGKIDIAGQPGRGTVLTAWVPLRQAV
jgi:signal transduction histidine kinase